MEQSQYLIDTNAVIDFLGNRFPVSGMNLMNGIIDAGPTISIITKIELLGFNAPTEYGKILTNFIQDASILDLTNNVVENCIEIRKKYRTKLPDSIIAATALAYNLTLITRNIPDFKIIENLPLIDPHNL